MLPTFILAGLGFALAFGPLNIAATSGVAPQEQGLAGGLLNTSFQFGGALVLAVVTAVDDAARGRGAARQALLDGFHSALEVSADRRAAGVLAMTIPSDRHLAANVAVEDTEPARELELERRLERGPGANRARPLPLQQKHRLPAHTRACPTTTRFPSNVEVGEPYSS